MKKVLLIAYHFPPLQGSSGLLRTLKFARYLEKFGFEATVLTVNIRAYEKLNYKLLAQVPKRVKIFRAFALDTQQHLSFRGKYFEFLAIPDRYASWIPFGILAGCQLVKKKKIDIIYATYPIASALVVGKWVSRLTKRPLVVDFRDPMYDEFFTLKRTAYRVRRGIEESAIRHSIHVIVTSPGTRELFRERYPEIKSDNLSVIPNGYDEQDFSNTRRIPTKRNGVRMIHTGLLDPVDRDPIPFFNALQMLKSNKIADRYGLKIELFAPGDESYYRDLTVNLNIHDLVKIKPSISYSDILAEMFHSDILLLFQGRSCDRQIPAKLYEYFRVGKPILAFTSRDGDTGKLISSHDAGLVISEDDPHQISAKCEKWIQEVACGKIQLSVVPDRIQDYSREKQTEKLAAIFDRILCDTGHS